MPVELILGGARSGKSRAAEQRAAAGGLEVTVIVTATGGDAEMRERIAVHRAARPAAWRTLEAPVDLVTALTTEARVDRVIIVDCLTMWLSNLMFAAGEPRAETKAFTPPAELAGLVAGLVETLPALPGRILLVSNEIGLGVAPKGAVSRFFGDTPGRLNQSVAAAATRVTLMVAGLPVEIKTGA